MPISLSPDYDVASLRAAARMSKDAGQTRRLLALAAIYDGATRTQAAAMIDLNITALTRLIVHADIYDTFLEKFSAAMQAA